MSHPIEQEVDNADVAAARRVPVSVGEQLRAAREAAFLSREEVALGFDTVPFRISARARRVAGRDGVRRDAGQRRRSRALPEADRRSLRSERVKHLRTVARIAAAINGLAVGAALVDAPRTAVALLAVSALLLIRNLEAIRFDLESRP